MAARIATTSSIRLAISRYIYATKSGVVISSLKNYLMDLGSTPGSCTTIIGKLRNVYTNYPGTAENCIYKIVDKKETWAQNGGQVSTFEADLDAD